MRLEEKFNLLIWWTLQALKNEYLLTPQKEMVKIDLDDLTNEDNAPSIKDVRKCIRKLEELGAFRIVEKYSREGSGGMFWEAPTNDWESASVFELEINQSKFNELYEKFKNQSRFLKNKIRENGILVKVSFDPKLCIVKCGKNTFKLQRKGIRCKILVELWKSRRIIDSNGEIKREGSFKPFWELAIASGIVKNEEEFEQKRATIERSIREAIKELRNKFKKIKAPVKIVAQHGYMLEVIE